MRRGKGLRRWRRWGREDKKTGKTSKKDKRIKGGENEMRGMMEGGRLRGREDGMGMGMRGRGRGRNEEQEEIGHGWRKVEDR